MRRERGTSERKRRDDEREGAATRAVGERGGVAVVPQDEIFDDGAVGAALLHEHRLEELPARRKRGAVCEGRFEEPHTDSDKCELEDEKRGDAFYGTKACGRRDIGLHSRESASLNVQRWPRAGPPSHQQALSTGSWLVTSASCGFSPARRGRQPTSREPLPVLSRDVHSDNVSGQNRLRTGAASRRDRANKVSPLKLRAASLRPRMTLIFLLYSKTDTHLQCDRTRLSVNNQRGWRRGKTKMRASGETRLDWQ